MTEPTDDAVWLPDVLGGGPAWRSKAIAKGAADIWPCSVCGIKTAGRVPSGFFPDGSATWPRSHKVNGTYCDGIYRDSDGYTVRKPSASYDG